MTKLKMMVVLDGDVAARLDGIANRYGMSKNLVVAAGAYELSRVRPENLWHALARIAEGEGTSLEPVSVIPEARRLGPGKERALATGQRAR